jgi:uncharacterized damage-inducible protein DinB
MNTNLAKKLLGCTFALLVAVPAVALAQEKPADMPASQAPSAAPANPITQSEKGLYSFISGTVIAAAQKMPEENYSFKPTPEVRSFGQIVGHVADAQYMFCSAAIGEANPSKDIEKTKTSKADLVAAMKDAQAYCMKTFAAMTDAKGAEMIKMMGFPMARMGVLSLNNAHTDEHYGNLVTYMRLKGLVPPTSENQGPPPAAK